MKVLKFIGMLILLLVAVVLIGALFVKKDYQIKREVTINAPKQKVFDYVRNIRNQNYFSVWNMKDPNMKQTESGTQGQVGYINSWVGNDDVGAGEQEIKKITEGESIEMELRFKKPFEIKNDAYMSTTSIDSTKTKVTWGFKGINPYPWNFMSLFMNMDKMLGPDLLKGLENLKVIMEKPEPVNNDVAPLKGGIAPSLNK